MMNQRIFKSTVFFLIVALTIGSIAVIALAKNGGNDNGKPGGGWQHGNQVQLKEQIKIQEQAPGPVQTQNQLQENKKIQKQLQECEKECNQNCENNCSGECIGECANEGTQLKFNAGALKNMTIAKIAELWKIDADTLLTEIVKTFNLTGTYTTENTLNDLRAEYRFAPFQIKEIIENLI